MTRQTCFLLCKEGQFGSCCTLDELSGLTGLRGPLLQGCRMSFRAARAHWTPSNPNSPEWGCLQWTRFSASSFSTPLNLPGHLPLPSALCPSIPIPPHPVDSSCPEFHQTPTGGPEGPCQSQGLPHTWLAKQWAMRKGGTWRRAPHFPLRLAHCLF